MSVLLVNKKARHDYSVDKTFTAGMVLSGPEVKSLRNKSGSLKGSHVKIIGNEAFLLNAQISPYKFADNREYDPKRTRKLLLKKKEIIAIAEKLEQKRMTVFPLKIFTMGKHIKVEIGIGRGLKQFEKKEKKKKKDLDRQAARDVRNYL